MFVTERFQIPLSEIEPYLDAFKDNHTIPWKGKKVAVTKVDMSASLGGACTVDVTTQVIEEAVPPAEAAIRELLKLTPNSGRAGLDETPKRFVKAFLEQTSGYEIDVPSLFKVFEDGAEDADQMVVVRGIEFQSLCEHHLLPFFGTADIGYLPSGKIVGLSKLARVLDAFAHRLQVQERLTSQVSHAIQEALDPVGVGVVIRARHFCMECRGVRKARVETVTSSLLGAFRTDSMVRAEFLDLSRAR